MFNPIPSCPGDMLGEMLLLVVYGHSGQVDKGGKPYSLHPLKIMHYLKSDDVELNCIALGHDLVEDNKKITFELLKAKGFTTRVIEGIRCLTKMPGESEAEYLEKILSNRDAMLVKLQDLRHNSDIRRLKGITEKDIARIAKYHAMYLTIKAAL